MKWYKKQMDALVKAPAEPFKTKNTTPKKAGHSFDMTKKGSKKIQSNLEKRSRPKTDSI